MDAALVLMLSAMTVMVSCHQICFIGSEYNPQSGIPPRWFLHKDPCECTAIRLGGINIPASSYRQGTPHYLKELFLSEDSDEIQAYFKCAAPDRQSPRWTSCPANFIVHVEAGHTSAKVDWTIEATDNGDLPPTVTCVPGPGQFNFGDHQVTCVAMDSAGNLATCHFQVIVEATCPSPGPLGMADRTIPDDRITASSGQTASCARLNNNCAWWPTRNPGNSWIDVDLIESTVVSGVTTQGHPNYFSYVKKYKVAYKKQPSSAEREHVMGGNGNIKVFIANDHNPVTNKFDASVVTTSVRIEPTEWQGSVALRLELLGCRRD